MYKRYFLYLLLVFFLNGCYQSFSNMPVKDIKNLAKEGDINAQMELAKAYEKGERLKKDYYEAFEWYLTAAKHENAQAQFKVGFYSLISRGTLLDYDEAYFWLNKASLNGNIESKYYLAKIYSEGKGRARNIEKAIDLLTIASEKNEYKSQSELARLYVNGIGVKKNLKKAIALYTSSAENGNISAQNNLAILYQLGRGVKKDIKKAIFWYKKASEQSSSNAQYNLALIYKSQKEYTKAYFVLKDSARKRHLESMKEIASLYKLGLGVKKNIKSSLFWYREAALKKDSYSQFIMGSHLLIGKGIDQDIGLGVKLLLKSAEQNNANSQNQLGLLSQSGIGVKKDYKKSLMWYSLAIKNGYTKAKCNMILPSLKLNNTKENRTKLKKIAEETYLETKYKFCKKIISLAGL